jgi:hypothetical protein
MKSPQKRSEEPPVNSVPNTIASSVLVSGAEHGTPERYQENDSDNSYEASPFCFKLDVTPPAAEGSAEQAQQMLAYASASPKGLQMSAEFSPQKPLDSLPSLSANWGATSPKKTTRLPLSPIPIPTSVVSPSRSAGAGEIRTPSSSSSNNTLEGIYLDIANKVDQYLAALSARENNRGNKNMNSTEVSSKALLGLCDDTKDYLKMLHSIVIGEWSKETLPEDDEMLRRHIEPLCSRLTR